MIITVGQEQVITGMLCDAISSFPFNSATAFENPFNYDNWHKPTDTLDKLDPKYIKEWIRFGIGFVIELSSKMN